MSGVVGSDWRIRQYSRRVKNLADSMTTLERSAVAGESPICEIDKTLWIGFPSTAGHVEPCGKLGGPSPKAKYYLVTDSE